MQQNLLSVIIPMYNCGNVITRCLDSIDYPQAEIIVVDDGSTDDGAKIVMQYANKHSNVCLLQKKNGGVSSARNMGIEKAQGMYIMFVDADDYIVPGGIEQVLDVAIHNNADVCKYWAKYPSATDEQDTNPIVAAKLSIRIINGKGAALRYYDLSDYVVWDGLYKRSLIISKNIRFKEDLHLHEDDEFMAEVYCEATKVIEINLPLYRYVVSSQNSACHDSVIATKRLQSSVLAIDYRQKAIANRCPNEKFPLEKYKYMRYVAGCLWGLLHTKIDYVTYCDYIKQFKELKCWPIRYKYIQIARNKYTIKLIVKMYLCNHPRIAFLYKTML